MKYRFGRAMEKKLGIKVLGPRGFTLAWRVVRSVSGTSSIHWYVTQA
jgi:hypothetical protein